MPEEESGAYLLDLSQDGSELGKANKAFDQLYGNKVKNSPNDTLIVYEGFEVYNHYLELAHLKDIDRVFCALTKPEIVNVIQECLVRSKIAMKKMRTVAETQNLPSFRAIKRMGR